MYKWYLRHFVTVFRLFSETYVSSLPASPASSSILGSRTGSLVLFDHGYCIEASPRKLRRNSQELQDELESCKKKLKLTQQSSRRLTRKVKSLEEVIVSLQENNLISVNCVSVLEKCMSGAALQLALRQLAKHKLIDFSDAKYPPELRAFALTLIFYSAKAYNFVRETFDLCLPHAKTLTKCYRSVNGNPRFSAEALDAVKRRSEASGKDVLCALVIDEMAIRLGV